MWKSSDERDRACAGEKTSNHIASANYAIAFKAISEYSSDQHKGNHWKESRRHNETEIASICSRDTQDSIGEGDGGHSISNV
jgi:hypothetical protein